MTLLDDELLDLHDLRWRSTGLPARLLRASSFAIADTYEGEISDPLQLHKYMYAGGNPVNNIDPSGNNYISQLIATGIRGVLQGISLAGTFVARQAAHALLRAQIAYYTASARLAVVLAGAAGTAFKVADRVIGQLRDPRLGHLANRLTPTILQRLASNPAAQRFVDTRAQNLNNIQIIQRVPGFSENTMVRITLAADDPSLIISVGPVAVRFIQNLIARGAWTRLG